MKIGIIGGGAAGVYLAIRLKELNSSFSVCIIEKNDKLLKKIAVTGNGRCNYANLGGTKGKYNNDEFANKVLENLSPKAIIGNFERYGIHPTTIDNLVYPVSLSAQTVMMMLEKQLQKLNVEVLLNEEVLDYSKKDSKFIVKTNNSEYAFDSLVFTSGGKAYPQLGTNGAMLDVLKAHGYAIETLSPSLSPIKVKENTKKISGQRVKCRVSFFSNDKLSYEEDGEVLFKDDGISGIVILNMSTKINGLKDKNNIKIVLDLAKGYNNIKEDDYEQYVHPKVASYLKEHSLDIHKVSFSFKAFYDYNIAEVSHGGVGINEISDSLESKKEKGLYFAGEVLDVDGMCGGFNLMFAFASAETVAKSIK